MKHGLIGDSSSQVEQCKFSEKSVVTEEGNCSSLPLKSPSGISAPASLHYAQSGTSSYLQLSNALNNLASKVKGQVLTVLGGEEFELAASGVDCARIPTPTDLEVLPSTRPFSRPNFFNPSREVPIVFSSVRALGSSSSNGLDKSVMSPISQGEGNTSSTSNSFPNLHQMSHAHGIPVTTIPRTSMPLISPVHREGEFICGWGAAFINICVTFPINKAIFRQQLHGISGRRAIRQLRKDGLQYLYRGLLPPLLQKTMSLSVMFGMYFHCQDVLKEHFPKLGIVPNHAMAAMISGTLEASLMPFERIQTLMQNRKFHNRFTNTPDAFRHLWRYGLKEYYRGLSLIIWRNGPSNVVFFLGREYFQTVTPQPDSPSKKVEYCNSCFKTSRNESRFESK